MDRLKVIVNDLVNHMGEDKVKDMVNDRIDYRE